jgi:7-carboxy-7-deazaguanine synthase
VTLPKRMAQELPDRAYAVKEIYYTFQGEGTHTGRPAVFLRFAGCNLWSGHEESRDRAVCQFCDTDFVGTSGPCGGRFPTAEALADAVAAAWTGDCESRQMVVCTGGEPLLQLDVAAVTALHRRGFYVAVETNGTREAVPGVDWVCLSPKAGAPLAIERADELKLVYPQPGLTPQDLQSFNAGAHLLQPMDGPDRNANTTAAITYCLAHPQWQISIQTHKYLGIP